MRYLLTSLLVAVLAATASGQSVFDLLHRGPLAAFTDMTITVPLDSLDARDPGELPGTLSFLDDDGVERHLSVEVSLRGKFRRTRCGTPPLKLDFDKDELRNIGLADHDKYKLVNSCYGDSTATDLILKEYLAYRAYAILSPGAHFRTQLLRLTYHDAAGVRPDRSEIAFLIEDPDEMAQRAGGKELEKAVGLEATDFVPEAEVTHALFQYLIGNADYSLPLQRNVKIVQLPDSSLLPVGYDFDFSGWVGAPYASPSRETGQQSIYQRVYLGFYQQDRTLRNVASSFRDHRRELLRMIDDFDLLNKLDRNRVRRFTSIFYEDLASMTTNTARLLYDQLRGDTADIIPPGAKPAHYRGSARR